MEHTTNNTEEDLRSEIKNIQTEVSELKTLVDKINIHWKVLPVQVLMIKLVSSKMKYKIPQ